LLSNTSHPCARLSLILFLILCSAAETVALCDYFDSSTLDPRWSWVREDPTHWSLTDYPGYLSIRMQHGDPYGTCNNNRNTLLQPAPTDNFEAVTCVTFNPTLNYQQAGLIVYQDTDNYVRLTRLHYEKGGGVQFFKEVGASTTAKAVGCDLTTTYLKIKKQDGTYTGYWSADGTNWNQVYQYTDVHLSNLKVGLAAFLGPSYTEIPANFDYICIAPIDTAQTPPEKDETEDAYLIFALDKDGHYIPDAEVWISGRGGYQHINKREYPSSRSLFEEELSIAYEDPCDKSLVTHCAVIDGILYCGMEGETMRNCGPCDIPDVQETTINIYGPPEYRSPEYRPTSESGCYSECINEKYIESVVSASPQGEFYCKAMCAESLSEKLFWLFLYDFNSLGSLS